MFVSSCHQGSRFEGEGSSTTTNILTSFTAASLQATSSQRKMSSRDIQEKSYMMSTSLFFPSSTIVAVIIATLLNVVYTVEGFQSHTTPYYALGRNKLTFLQKNIQDDGISFFTSTTPQQTNGQRHTSISFQRTTRSSHSLTVCYGIPKMFRWLTDQYPNVIHRRLSEGLRRDVVVDNFYLDMNGIIHPCTHGNSDTFVVLDETAMFKKIFGYVDRLYKMVRPRKVLYLAVDGVAPRAKMNQQRSRRFRSGKEAEDLAASIVAKEGKLPDVKRFDSNCITPGTDFMLKLNLAMKKWIEFKQATDPLWMVQNGGCEVIYSGPDVPGEGEHKVMDYIREYQLSANYQKNTHHVLYGLDADLIMLGLVTHEPKFMLLREKMSVVMGGRRRGRGPQRRKKDVLEYQRDDYELLDLLALKEMFQIQFRKFADTGKGEQLLKVKYDVNRILDDFVFMCMLVGNDFLPHCPHLEIDGGALSLMLSIYIDMLPKWGDYLSDKDSIHPERFEEFIYEVAAYEEEHFRRRAYEENEPGFALAASPDEFYGTFYEQPDSWSNFVPPSNGDGGHHTPAVSHDEKHNKKATSKYQKKHPEDIDDDEFVIKSYRDFYYKEKLGITTRDERRQVVKDYLEGLHWVLHYYHKGCGSWEWYFPHLYSPLATDMVNIRDFYSSDEEEESNNGEESSANDDENGFCRIPFEHGRIFPPLAQLLSVLPPQSAELLPNQLSELMLNPSSPLAEYYPKTFQTDQNGKRQSWEAVVKIPFIDAKLLLETVDSVLDDTTPERQLTMFEKKRNEMGTIHTFVPPQNNIGVDDSSTTTMKGGSQYNGGASASASASPSRSSNPRRRTTQQTNGSGKRPTSQQRGRYSSDGSTKTRSGKGSSSPRSTSRR